MTGPIHWNVKGLKVVNYEKVKKCCSILEQAQNVLFLNLQETHLECDNDIPRKLLNFSHLYHLVSSHANEDDRGAGILLFINKTEEILSTENIFPGRLLYAKTRNKATGIERNIFSFYAKSHAHTNEIKGYMSAIYDRVFSQDLRGIMIAGDFNFVTSLLDRNGSSFTATDNMYRHEWQKVEVSLGLSDCFRITSPKRRVYSYTHTNGSSRSRLDRIYISNDLQGKVVSSLYEHTLSSDHKIFRMKLAQEVDSGPGIWIFNNTLLEDEDFVKKVKDIISEYAIDQPFSSHKLRWDFLKQNIASFSQNYSKQKARKDRHEHENILKRLEILESLPKDEVTESIKNTIADLKAKERSIKDKKLEGIILRSKLPHVEKNENDISFYARLEKVTGEKNNIYALVDSEGQLKEGTSEVSGIIHDFYSDLYKKETECEVTQNEFLENVSVQLSEEDRADLDKDFTQEEFTSSLLDLQNRKSPGCDGLTKEFYNYFWSDLSDIYYQCLKECESTGTLTTSQRKGLIRISYKKNGRIYIKNYRPITLLNVDLKIFTKTLAKRMARVLPKIIHRNQKCVPGRSMSYNIHIIQDLIDAVNSSDGGAAFIFLDQEKAFDRMSHKFILKTLRKFGFGEKFISWIKMIYNDTSSAVKVNGYITPSFSIERGVRQGCPLSSMLYVLCAEVLAIEIRTNEKIVGYKYNNGKDEHKITQYADDNAVCVTKRHSIPEVFRVLEKYDAATNSRNNVDKTVGLLVGNFRGSTDLFAGITWQEDPVLCLGSYVGNERTECNSKSFTEIQEKIKIKMTYWSGKHLSLKGRVRVLNIFILSKLWSVLESQDIPSNMLKDFNNLISDFVWNDLHQAQLAHLHQKHIDGGLNLQDIELKMKSYRIKWLRDLALCDDSFVEKSLANSLIGKHGKIVGLKILNASNVYDKQISSPFYKNAVKAWRILCIDFQPGSIADIRRDWVYESILLKDDDGRVFKPPSFIPPYAPEFIYDLPITNHPREFRGRFKRLIPKMNLAFMKIKFSDSRKNEYLVQTNKGPTNINCLRFGEIYDILLKERASPRLPWKRKWEDENAILPTDWSSVWENVHSPLLVNEVQSSLWEMLHRNFMCGYFERMAFNGDGKCKLCGEYQNERIHIFVTCKLIESVFDSLLPTLNSIINLGPLSHKERLVGLDVKKDSDERHILRNYFTSIVKHVIFRSRNSKFGNLNNTKEIMIKKIKIYIKNDLKYKHKIATITRKLDSFIKSYLCSSILGKLSEDNNLEFSNLLL